MMPSALLQSLIRRREILASSLYQSLATQAEVHKLDGFIARVKHQEAPLSGMEPVQLELWKINGAQDYLCTQYEGTIWEVFNGPYPETDTHPNCRCERIPFAGDLTRAAPSSRNPYGPDGASGMPIISGGGRTGYEGVTNQPAIGGVPVSSSPTLLPVLGPAGSIIAAGAAAVWIAELERERKRQERAEIKRVRELEKEEAQRKKEAEKEAERYIAEMIKRLG